MPYLMPCIQSDESEEMEDDGARASADGLEPIATSRDQNDHRGQASKDAWDSRSKEDEDGMRLDDTVSLSSQDELIGMHHAFQNFMGKCTLSLLTLPRHERARAIQTMIICRACTDLYVRLWTASNPVEQRAGRG